VRPAPASYDALNATENPMRPAAALYAALAAAALGLAASDARALTCYVVFDRTDNVIYRDTFPPVDLSDAGKAEREAMRKRGEFLLFMDVDQCPRLEFITGAAGNVALKLEETMAPTGEPAKSAAPKAAARAPRAPR
jgi:hypothetical protein